MQLGEGLPGELVGTGIPPCPESGMGADVRAGGQSFVADE